MSREPTENGDNALSQRLAIVGLTIVVLLAYVRLAQSQTNGTPAPNSAPQQTVNGVVSNMPEFQQAFQGGTTNGEDKRMPDLVNPCWKFCR
jgi:hypothetical protein